MDFESLVGHDDAFDEEPQDCLAHVEIGVSEASAERAGDFVRAKRPVVRDLRFEALRSETVQLLFRRETRLLDAGDSLAKEIQRECTDLIRVGQAVSLPGQIVKPRDRARQPHLGFRTC